ncbi:MAG: nucleoside hydrolase [Acidimicrobiia bacterium]|nr:nucleoside hydrolase [Acidimicrobiia bacterium]
MRLVIDTDLGMGTAGADPEDGLAILYALRSPSVSLEGLTLVHGNVPVSHSWPNARRLLDLAGRADIALHAGERGPRDPLRRRLQAGWLAARGSPSGGTPDDTPPPATATEFLREIVVGSPGEITIAAIGPLTNVAAAVESDPGFAGALAGLVVMGGTVAVPGNITPAAEFNIWMDPEAASIVFDSGSPITMAGLDVCHRTHLDRAQTAQAGASGTRLAEFVAQACDAWIDVRAGLLEGDEDLHLYDTLAVAAAIAPDLLDYIDALVEVETSTGPAQGMTVTHTNATLRRLLTGREANARVAIGVDTGRFERLFAERVMAGL